MFHRITQFLHRHLPATISKKHIGIFLVLSAFVGVMLFGLSTQSVSAIDSFNVRDGVLEFFTKICIVLARLAMAFGIFFLRFFIQLAAYNGYLDAPIVRLGWVMLRDIGNMFFVVALLVIAFATILGRESYEWKKAMVKLVLVAIVVNFSLLICGLVLDAAHVFTVTFVNAIAPVAAGNLIEMFNFNEMERIITDTGTEGSPDIKLALFGGAVVALGFSVMAAIAIGAYCVVLLARMVAIWALLIFSPLAFILSVLPATENYFEEWKSEFTKNVLSAPIAVFFLWLAFATMSANGGIVKHLDDHSSGNTIGDIAADSTGAGDQVVQVAQDNAVVNSVSLNVASTWANMAGFLVAFVFLLKGIEQVQSLGVAGAGWLDSASSFAKTVVTYGSGYAFGRWLVGKGIEGGKAAASGVFERIPFVGGAALREQKARLAHHFTEHGVLGVGGVRRKIANSERAKKLEEKGGAWNIIQARWFEPAERAAKRAQDWEKAAENLHHIQEESYSTSNSAAGQAKQNTGTEKEAVEHKAAAKGKEKMALRTALAIELYDLSKHGSLSAEDTKAAYFAKIEKDVRKGRTTPAADAEVKEALEKAGKVLDQNGVSKLVTLGHNIHEGLEATAKSNAGAEEASEPEHHLVERLTARERDKIRIKQNLAPMYEKQVLDKRDKELVEKMSGMGHWDIVNAAADYMRQPNKDPQVILASAATLSAAYKKGEETGHETSMAMLNALGYAQSEIDAMGNTIEGQQRLMLAKLLHRKVASTDSVTALYSDFVTSLGGGTQGEERAQTVMRSLDASTKVMITNGAVNLAGMIDASGPSTVFTTDPTKLTAAGTKATRDLWARKVNISNLEHFRGALGGVIGSGSTYSISRDPLALSQLVQMFKGIKSNTPLKSDFVDNLQTLKQFDLAGFTAMINDPNLPIEAANVLIEKTNRTGTRLPPRR